MKKIAYVSMAALSAVSSVAGMGAVVSNADTVESKKMVELSVPVKLMKENENAVSMGNNALVDKATVVQKDGKTEIYLTFRGLEFNKMFGHLTGIEVFEAGKDSKAVPAEVVKTFKEKDLNGKEREFPQVVKIVRDKDNEKQLYIKVFVDAMASIATGGKDPYLAENKDKGGQVARLELDYDKATKTGKTEEKNTENKDVPKQEVKTMRVEGSNRYDTAVEISKKYFKSADTVVLANGRIYADALAASPLASLMKAPILLSESKTISKNTLDEIARLKAKEVVIVGGDNSISKDVENMLKEKKIDVKRVSGENRYMTSLNISKMVKKMAPSDQVLLVSGQNFADALSVSSMATEKKMPIILTESKAINPTVKAELDSWNLKGVTVVGGENSVSSAVVKEIKAKENNRIAGKNRFETSVMVAKNAYPKTDKLFAASGENPADALSVGAVTAMQKTPLVLVSKNAVDPSLKAFVKENKIMNITVFGGMNSVSSEVEKGF